MADVPNIDDDSGLSPLATIILENASASPQTQSRLLQLPLELLEPIINEVFRARRETGVRRYGRHYRVDLQLLLTCRLAYIRGHRMPYSNPCMYDSRDRHMHCDSGNALGLQHLRSYLLPWQWTCIRHLRLTVKQSTLEDGALVTVATLLDTAVGNHESLQYTAEPMTELGTGTVTRSPTAEYATYQAHPSRETSWIRMSKSARAGS